MASKHFSCNFTSACVCGEREREVAQNINSDFYFSKWLDFLPQALYHFYNQNKARGQQRGLLGAPIPEEKATLPHMATLLTAGT